MIMMKKLYLVSLALVASMTCAKAQVTIGSQEEPHPAAVLDLKSTTTSGKGLLLPNVEITNLTSFGFAGDPNEATGMIIYCPGKNVEKGVYLWDGSKWVLLLYAPSTRAAVLNEEEEVNSNHQEDFN